MLNFIDPSASLQFMATMFSHFKENFIENASGKSQGVSIVHSLEKLNN